MSSAESEAVLVGRLIERLLVDVVFRAEFRRDPVGVCREFGLEGLAGELGGGGGLYTLELRESRSSLAGVVMAVAAEGVGVAELQGLVGRGLHGEARAAALRALHGGGVREPRLRPAGGVGRLERVVEGQVRGAGGGGSGSSGSAGGHLGVGGSAVGGHSAAGGAPAAGGGAPRLVVVRRRLVVLVVLVVVRRRLVVVVGCRRLVVVLRLGRLGRLVVLWRVVLRVVVGGRLGVWFRRRLVVGGMGSRVRRVGRMGRRCRRRRVVVLVGRGWVWLIRRRRLVVGCRRLVVVLRLVVGRGWVCRLGRRGLGLVGCWRVVLVVGGLGLVGWLSCCLVRSCRCRRRCGRRLRRVVWIRGWCRCWGAIDAELADGNAVAQTQIAEIELFPANRR